MGLNPREAGGLRPPRAPRPRFAPLGRQVAEDFGPHSRRGAPRGRKNQQVLKHQTLMVLRYRGERKGGRFFAAHPVTVSRSP